MGSNCSCLKSKSEDQYQLKVVEDDRPAQNQENPQLLSKQTLTHSDIIKIQGLLRGFLERKKMLYMNYMDKYSNKTSSAIYLVTRASTHRSMRSGENTPNTSFCENNH